MKRINKEIIGISILAGLLSCWIDFQLFYKYKEVIYMPILVGILFSILFLITFILIWITSIVDQTFDWEVVNEKGIEKYIGISILCLLITFCASFSFEWIYELNFQENDIEATSYIFVVDDSGSMEYNDPLNIRKDAVEKTYKELNVPYTIYTFASDIECQKKMELKSNGTTRIKGVLEQILEDKGKTWKDTKRTKVVLLTDGAATDIISFFGISFGLDSILHQYNENGICISTVGLGESCDDSLMTKIAQSTGGTYIHIDDATDLVEAMTKAANSYAERNLLSFRFCAKQNWVYMLERMIFLFLLCTGIGISMALAYGKSDSIYLIIKYSLMEGIFSAILFEAGIQMGISQIIIWILYWLCTALTIVVKDYIGNSKYVRLDDYLHLYY